MTALNRLGVWIGGAALLAATLIDTFAVIGRNVGMPILGSIELVQAAVLVSGVLGLIFATAHDDHARVRLVTDRLRKSRGLVEAASLVAMVVFFAALLAGSLWLSFDLWNGHERSELIGVPWSALRMIANVGLAICIAVTLGLLFRRKRP